MAESSESEGQANGGTSLQEEPVDGMWKGTSPEEDHEFTSTVNVKMETMNTASSTINKLSAELEKARSCYSLQLRQSMEYIKKLGKDSAKSCEKAKPFYDVFREARQLQDKCRNAAVLYERASQKHQAAKEVVAIAEAELFQNVQGSGSTKLNAAWQETLSHGVEKVNETETAKRESEAEHMRLTAALQHVMERYRITEIKLRKDIKKAHYFYMERSRCNQELKSMRDSIQRLRSQLVVQRKEYRSAIRQLELISEEIHRRRSFSHHPSGMKESYKDEVSALEAQAGLVGLNITEDARASDEHIHYCPDDVDSRTSESSSIQQDNESQGSVDVGAVEYYGEDEDSFAVERPQQSPLVNSACAHRDVPHQSNGHLLEVQHETSEDAVAGTSADTVTESAKEDTVTKASNDTSTEALKEDTVTKASNDTSTEALKEDTLTEASKDTSTEASKEDTVTEASKDTSTEASKEDTVTEGDCTSDGEDGESTVESNVR